LKDSRRCALSSALLLYNPLRPDNRSSAWPVRGTLRHVTCYSSFRSQLRSVCLIVATQVSPPRAGLQPCLELCRIHLWPCGQVVVSFAMLPMYVPLCVLFALVQRRCTFRHTAPSPVTTPPMQVRVAFVVFRSPSMLQAFFLRLILRLVTDW
jgi:hypothetical protein